MVRTLQGARILILFPHMVTPGGALNYTLRLAGEMAEQGARVAILVLKSAESAGEVPAGVEVINLDGPLTSSLRYWLLFPCWQRKINRAVSAWNPEVVVSQVFPSNWWGWLFKKKYPGIRMVWVSHEPSAFIHSEELIAGLRPFWKRWLANGLHLPLRTTDLRLARQSDRVVANSLHTARACARVYGRRCDAVATPGIDLEVFFPGDGPREPALITVAHLVPYKNVDFLLRVFARLRARHPDLVFHIVGEGPAQGELQALAENLGLDAHVSFHDRLAQADLAALLRRMTLFLSAGAIETFGMASLEAIACGTPVVAYDSGGLREFVDERCGRLIDTLEIEDWVREIAGYLDQLATHPDAAQRVSSCARDYSWHQTLRPAVDVIAGLCAAEKQQYD